MRSAPPALSEAAERVGRRFSASGFRGRTSDFGLRPAICFSFNGRKLPSSQQATNVSVTDFNSSHRARICFDLLLCDLIVGGRGGHHRQQIGKFLHDFIGGGDQVGGMRVGGLGILDEEAPGALADPLDEARVVGAADQRVDAVQRVGAAAAGGGIARLGPLVDHRKREPQLGGHLLGAAPLEDFTQDFV